MGINDLVEKLKDDFPSLSFVAGTRAYWSPEQQQVFYRVTTGSKEQAKMWALLHEVGHAVLAHKSYTTDIDLLRKEVEAWAKAEELAVVYGSTIDNTYAQDCLETYRQWLFKRSTCPSCGARGVQNTEKEYICLNCEMHWSVSTSRFCRPYRGVSRISGTQKKSQGHSPWLFVENVPV